MVDRRNDIPDDEIDEANELHDLPSGETSDYAIAQACFGTAKEVVNRYTHCQLCGANLHFSHITDFSRNLTQEVARCPECGVKARSMTHRLQ